MKIKFKSLCAAIAVTAAASACSNQFDNNYTSGINMQENIKLDFKKLLVIMIHYMKISKQD